MIWVRSKGADFWTQGGRARERQPCQPKKQPLPFKTPNKKNVHRVKVSENITRETKFKCMEKLSPKATSEIIYGNNTRGMLIMDKVTQS